MGWDKTRYRPWTRLIGKEQKLWRGITNGAMGGNWMSDADIAPELTVMESLGT